MFKTILNNFHLEKLIWIVKSKLMYMIVVALTGAILAGGYAYMNQTSTYCAEISFYVYSNPDYVTNTGINLSSSEITQASTLLTSYKQILLSNSFLSKLIQYTGLEEYCTVPYLQKRISASAVSGTAVFEVRVYDDDPIIATTIANAIGELAPAEIVSVVKSGGIEVLDEAELPTKPYATTSVLTYAVVGAAGGFLFAAVCFVIAGLLNTTIRRKYEIEDLFTIPILGTIPLLSGDKKNEINPLLEEGSSFEWKEAYRELRANLMFQNTQDKCPVYAITSADCGEGKTLCTLNLAISFSKIGKKVLIIDADLRKSNMGDILSIDKEWKEGLSDYLSGEIDNMQVIENSENLHIMLAGTMATDSAELLASEKWYSLLEKCKEKYDMIFIDLPSLGIVSDALSLARITTSYILVVREQQTRFEREEMIVRKLEALDADICGFIYNGMSPKSPDYNYRRHGKEYRG